MDNFESKLQTLQESQFRRLQNKKGAEGVEEYNVELVRARLTFKDITQACWTELKRIAVIKYEENTQLSVSSNRLEGHGWSTLHIKNHMDRFLKDLLEQQNDILRKFL